VLTLDFSCAPSTATLARSTSEFHCISEIEVLLDTKSDPVGIDPCEGDSTILVVTTVRWITPRQNCFVSSAQVVTRQSCRVVVDMSVIQAWIVQSHQSVCVRPITNGSVKVDRTTSQCGLRWVCRWAEICPSKACFGGAMRDRSVDGASMEKHPKQTLANRALPIPSRTLPPPRQRGCTCSCARSRLWSWPACQVSMRRRARLRQKARVLHARAWNFKMH